jgi:hypothetical protein
MDAAVAYMIKDQVQIFPSVDNIANKGPAPHSVAGTGIGSAQIGVDQTYYDVIGQSFRGGVRFQF